jgi:hypothetical protein
MTVRPSLFFCACVTTAAALSACANFDRSGTADGLARTAGMTRALVRTDSFLLTAFARQRDPAAPLVVYIEGDGLAWLSRSEPSADPTPRQPLALELAVLDPAPNVLYLARPCQYTVQQDPHCSTQYWTSRRFSGEVISATNQAIDQYLRNGGRGVRLVGYSGGAAVAALVAARRSDVIDLRTVAGNLDHVALNRHHNVSQQTGSLNAADAAPGLADVPQLHLIGGRDKIVLPQFAEGYARRAGDRRCIEIARVEDASHESGWTAVWPAVLRRQVTCGGARS